MSYNCHFSRYDFGRSYFIKVQCVYCFNYDILLQLESVPESLEDALSTAIAKARIYDAQHGTVS